VDRREEGRLRTGPLAAEDEDAAVALLARAFRDNPLNAAVIRGGPERRLRSNRNGMRALLPMALAHGEVWGLREEGRLWAALVGVPPLRQPLPPPPLGLRLRTLFGQGLPVALRWARVFEELDRLHPEEPHWYLGTFGVDPSRQGRGLGRGLLDAWLARLDAAGEPPVYLETDRPENVPFYERAGFAVVRETAVFDVPVWCMSREARNPG
jgi:ribosomal protein S18 acetylase RimI-like enzyme